MTEPASYSGHEEHHLVHRVGWLRAAVLGANDGILSTASLVVGFATASAGRGEILLAGFAGMVAGAMSMAAGEYVSVSSQADLEKADLKKEAKALREMPEEELQELTNIYIARGVRPDTARDVARQLSAKDALKAHARDELGLSEIAEAQPVLAAVSSAASFAVGAALPLAASALSPLHLVAPVVVAASLVSLAILGVVAARVGGAKPVRPVGRIVLWGAAAMALTAAVGHFFGAAV